MREFQCDVDVIDIPEISEEERVEMESLDPVMEEIALLLGSGSLSAVRLG